MSGVIWCILDPLLLSRSRVLITPVDRASTCNVPSLTKYFAMKNYCEVGFRVASSIKSRSTEIKLGELHLQLTSRQEDSAKLQNLFFITYEQDYSALFILTSAESRSSQHFTMTSEIVIIISKPIQVLSLLSWSIEEQIRM